MFVKLQIMTEQNVNNQQVQKSPFVKMKQLFWKESASHKLQFKTCILTSINI